MTTVSIALRMLVVGFAAWILVGPATGGRPDAATAGPTGARTVADDRRGDEPGEAGIDAEALYRTRCAACHARDGDGIEGRGPSLLDEGRAAADFVLRTGRMPLADVDRQPVRKRPSFTEAEIVALVDYVGRLGDGVDIPDVDPSVGSVSRGAAIYRLNCAACHVASGAGAVIGSGRTAPALTDATPTQVGEAIVVGPGAMPVFGALSEQDIDDVAAYVVTLQEEGTTGADALGGVGPVAEGLAAWLLGVLPIVALCRWIGSPHEQEDDELVDGERPERTRA